MRCVKVKSTSKEKLTTFSGLRKGRLAYLIIIALPKVQLNQQGTFPLEAPMLSRFETKFSVPPKFGPNCRLSGKLGSKRTVMVFIGTTKGVKRRRLTGRAPQHVVDSV